MKLDEILGWKLLQPDDDRSLAKIWLVVRSGCSPATDPKDGAWLDHAAKLVLSISKHLREVGRQGRPVTRSELSSKRRAHGAAALRITQQGMDDQGHRHQ